MGASKKLYQEIEEQKQYAREILEKLLEDYPVGYVVDDMEKLREELLSR